MAMVDLPIEKIQAACEEYMVQRLELFGSAATDRFDSSTSDYDFLVTFKPMRLEQRADTFFGILFALEDLLVQKIDLVDKEAIRNPYFFQSVQQTPRKLIYESRPTEVVA